MYDSWSQLETKLNGWCYQHFPHIYIIGFTHSSTGNGNGDIFTGNLRYASGGYLIFEKLYFSGGFLFVTLYLVNYNFL